MANTFEQGVDSFIELAMAAQLISDLDVPVDEVIERIRNATREVDAVSNLFESDIVHRMYAEAKDRFKGLKAEIDTIEIEETDE